MHYVILGYDADDAEALNRRNAVRGEHLKLAEKNFKNKKLLYAAGLLNQQEQLIGSNMIMDFDSEEELNEYLGNEPYVKGKVWNEIKVYPAKVPPFCVK